MALERRQVGRKREREPDWRLAAFGGLNLAFFARIMVVLGRPAAWVSVAFGIGLGFYSLGRTRKDDE